MNFTVLCMLVPSPSLTIIECVACSSRLAKNGNCHGNSVLCLPQATSSSVTLSRPHNKQAVPLPLGCWFTWLSQCVRLCFSAGCCHVGCKHPCDHVTGHQGQALVCRLALTALPTVQLLANSASHTIRWQETVWYCMPNCTTLPMQPGNPCVSQARQHHVTWKLHS